MPAAHPAFIPPLPTPPPSTFLRSHPLQHPPPLSPRHSLTPLSCLPAPPQPTRTGITPTSSTPPSSFPTPLPSIPTPAPNTPPPHTRILLIAGFETFNLSVYTTSATRLQSHGIHVVVFTDRDLERRDPRLELALRNADVLFCSLIFDYDQVEWLNARIHPGIQVFVFESALELMARTSVGRFTMKRAGVKESSPRGGGGVVPALLKRLGLAGREEDKLAGYLGMLKMAPKLLRFVPGAMARDLKNWLTVYAYWNGGGVDNVVKMARYIAAEVLGRAEWEGGDVVQLPNFGLVHPQYQGFFEHPADYVQWYLRRWPERTEWPRAGLLLYRKHVVSGLQYIPDVIDAFESAGLIPIPVFITGVEAHIVVRDYFTSADKEERRKGGQRVYGSNRRGKTARVDAVVSTIGFPLVGGPAGSMAGGRNADVGQVILKQLNVPYIVAAPLLIQDLQSWRKNGVAGLQSVVLYSLPELDGAIDTVCIGGLVGDEICLIGDRVERLTGRIKKWVELRRKKNEHKRVGIVIYGFPPSIGATGTAALLNVPRSLSNIFKRLKAEGYDVGDGDTLSPEQILEMVKQSDEVMQGGKLDGASARQALNNITTVESERLREWIGAENSERIERSWNVALGSSTNIKTVDKRHLLGGVQFGNIWIGVQPPLGIVGDPMRMMFERDLTPHPQYAAFYRWLENGFKADATIHVGTHGTYEWLPGNPLGNSRENWSDIFMGNLPNLYVYAANNPSEGSLAKRRGYATIVSHNVPPYGRAALYGQLEEMKSLIWDFNERMQSTGPGEQTSEIRKTLEDKLVTSGLNVDLGINLEEASTLDFMGDVSNYLKTLESRLYSSGLHVLGQAPSPTEALGFVEAILGEEEETIPEKDRLPLGKCIVAAAMDVTGEPDAELWGNLEQNPYKDNGVVLKAVEIVEKLQQTGNELDNIVRGLSGEFIEALPGGDVLRDGASILPTGSNIHALDPYRLPSQAAYATGRGIAERVIQAHREANDGEYPETVAVPLWGLDNIKTKGESVGIALGLIGARPTLDGTGRVVRFDLIDISELGRPRVDVLLNLSGIFRDSFEHVVFLLDDVCRRAAEAQEPIGENFIKKHSQAMECEDEGVDSGARIFSNPPADYGSMVNEQVADSTWENGDELASTYVSRNAYMYGRNNNGKRSEATFKRVLSTTSRVVQQIDSVEYGLSDIQEYYANTGALVRAARVESKNEKVGASIVESFGAAGDGAAGREAKDLEEVLRMELRTRLLNPKWAEKMLENGTGGAFEVSTRMTALIGWGGTTGYGDDFVFEQAAERYVLDEKNREIMRVSSPEAYRNVLSRFLEAAGRGIWKNPDESLLNDIRQQLEDVDAEIEGVQ